MVWANCQKTWPELARNWSAASQSSFSSVLAVVSFPNGAIQIMGSGAEGRGQVLAVYLPWILAPDEEKTQKAGRVQTGGVVSDENRFHCASSIKKSRIAESCAFTEKVASKKMVSGRIANCLKLEGAKKMEEGLWGGIR